jgi:hypothetical protein
MGLHSCGLALHRETDYPVSVLWMETEEPEKLVKNIN